jgi:two-component system, NarL family, response regulator YdfI
VDGDAGEFTRRVIRILVCASSALARAGLAAIVRGDSRLTFAGEASPLELERSIASYDPDVVLEQRDGIADIARFPTVALVDDPRAAWANDQSGPSDQGAHAILARDTSPDEIVAAIVAVAAGLVAVQPRALVPARVPGGERLTAREVEVLGELARGVPNKAIAARLEISEHTVKFHIASLFAKLGAASRTEAVTQGIRRGLIML